MNSFQVCAEAFRRWDARQSSLPATAKSHGTLKNGCTESRPAVVLWRVAEAFRGSLYARQHAPSHRDQSLDVNDTRARWPPYAPFCSDGIGLSVLPGALRLLGLAPVGCRRLTRSRVNVLAGRFILDAGCVVSAPLPALSGPSACAGPPTWGGGTFLSDPEGPPSAVRGLLAEQLIHRLLFGPSDLGTSRLESCGGQTYKQMSHRRRRGWRAPHPPGKFYLPSHERWRRYGPRGPDHRVARRLRRHLPRRSRPPGRDRPRRHRDLSDTVRHHVGPPGSVSISSDRDRDLGHRLPRRLPFVEFLVAPGHRRALPDRREFLSSRRNLVDRTRVRRAGARPLDGIPERLWGCRSHPRNREQRGPRGCARVAVAVPVVGRHQLGRGRRRLVGKPRAIFAAPPRNAIDLGLRGRPPGRAPVVAPPRPGRGRVQHRRLLRTAPPALEVRPRGERRGDRGRPLDSGRDRGHVLLRPSECPIRPVPSPRGIVRGARRRDARRRDHRERVDGAGRHVDARLRALPDLPRALLVRLRIESSSLARCRVRPGLWLPARRRRDRGLSRGRPRERVWFRCGHADVHPVPVRGVARPCGVHRPACGTSPRRERPESGSVAHSALVTIEDRTRLTSIRPCFAEGVTPSPWLEKVIRSGGWT